MGFRFRFETILRQKQQIVDEVAGRLAHAARLIQAEERHLATLHEAATVHRMRFAAALQPGTLDAGTLQSRARYGEFLQRVITDQSVRISKMRERETQIRDLLVQAEKDRQIYENLKEQHRTAFYAELADKERRYFDETANTIHTAKHQAHLLYGEQ